MCEFQGVHDEGLQSAHLISCSADLLDFLHYNNK